MKGLQREDLNLQGTVCFTSNGGMPIVLYGRGLINGGTQAKANIWFQEGCEWGV
jgi:hypothetical protein